MELWVVADGGGYRLAGAGADVELVSRFLDDLGEPELRCGDPPGTPMTC